jgi:hypothetical protein
MPPALQVVMIVDAFFFEKVVANDSIRVLALGSAEAYAAALADPEARWRKPVPRVRWAAERVRFSQESLTAATHSSWRACSPRRPRKP